MILHSPISSHAHFVEHLALTSPSLSSPALRPRCSPRSVAIRCSSPVTKVHNYGTVDFERRPRIKWQSLYGRIATSESLGVQSAGDIVDEWDRDVQRLSKWELRRIVKELRKFKRYRLALEVFNWMESQGRRFNLTNSDMAIQLYLIAKVYDVSHAEEFFEKLPESLKEDKRVYGALLNVYGEEKMKEKAEALVGTMKRKGYAYDVLPYNVMMTLYMNLGEHERVWEIKNEMKERNVPIDVFTYNILITNAAAMKDEEEIERISNEITANSNVNANWTTYTTLAAMYVRLGNFEKAESCLKDAKLRMTGRERAPFDYLLGLYGSIGKIEEVYRVWQWYKISFPSMLNLGYQAMVSSLTKLKDFDGSKVIYEEWLSSTKNYDPRICNILMGSFVREGLVDEAKDVLDSFINKGGKPKPITWELLLEGYINSKQLSEALLALRAAMSYEGSSYWKLRPTNVFNLLNLCKEQGDSVSEKIIIELLRQRGFLEMEEYKFLSK